MSHVQIYEMVASGKLTPAQAAELMSVADRKRREWRRPEWMPNAVWIGLGIVAGIALAPFGISNES